MDALSLVAERLGDGRSLAAFAATCRICKLAAYDERLWRRECERRFGPIAPPPPRPPRAPVAAKAMAGGPKETATAAVPELSWRRLYAFNAAAYERVVAAARAAERSLAMARLLGAGGGSGAAGRRWLAASAAFAH
jgi:hypothetical protein